MKIDEAITILSESANQGMTTFNDKFREAQKLGIEALKRVKIERTGYELYAPDLLPGETEEVNK